MVPDLRHQCHQETCQKCKFSGSIPNLLNQELWAQQCVLWQGLQGFWCVQIHSDIIHHDTVWELLLSSIHSFNKYILSACYVSGTGDKMMNVERVPALLEPMFQWCAWFPAFAQVLTLQAGSDISPWLQAQPTDYLHRPLKFFSLLLSIDFFYLATLLNWFISSNSCVCLCVCNL